MSPETFLYVTADGRETWTVDTKRVDVEVKPIHHKIHNVEDGTVCQSFLVRMDVIINGEIT